MGLARGTRLLRGEEANDYYELIDEMAEEVELAGYEYIVLPSIWEAQTFIDKAGPEIVNQMYVFKDKKDRDLCLIPEVTACIQELYREQWQREKKPIRLYYCQKCYRYERPQAGRYREFTQFGIEHLGGNAPEDREEVEKLLESIIQDQLVIMRDDEAVEYTMNGQVARGLHYYTEEGFEVEVPVLGAQKQVAGGGRYAEGIGWAIGVDRLLIAAKGGADG